MKTQKFKLIISCIAILALSFTCCAKAMATEPPAILSIFTKYSDYKGVTMFEASDELLKTYKISTFKSIYFQKMQVPLKEIKTCIDKDKVGASTIKETVKDGLIFSGYYKLKNIRPNVNRYIIFKVNDDGIHGTLIFIEGEISPNELVNLLK